MISLILFLIVLFGVVESCLSWENFLPDLSALVYTQLLIIFIISISVCVLSALSVHLTWIYIFNICPLDFCVSPLCGLKYSNWLEIQFLCQFSKIGYVFLWLCISLVFLQFPFWLDCFVVTACRPASHTKQVFGYEFFVIITFSFIIYLFYLVLWNL